MNSIATNLYTAAKTAIMEDFHSDELSKLIELREILNGASLFFNGKKAVGLTYLKTFTRATIDVQYRAFLENVIEIEKSTPQGVSFICSPETDFSILKDFFCAAFDNSCSKDIGCCSRYKECSAQGKCLNDNPEIFLGCYYRNNLKNGKIFY